MDSMAWFTICADSMQSCSVDQFKPSQADQGSFIKFVEVHAMMGQVMFVWCEVTTDKFCTSVVHTRHGSSVIRAQFASFTHKSITYHITYLC